MLCLIDSTTQNFIPASLHDVSNLFYILLLFSIHSSYFTCTFQVTHCNCLHSISLSFNLHPCFTWKCVNWCKYPITWSLFFYIHTLWPFFLHTPERSDPLPPLLRCFPLLCHYVHTKLNCINSSPLFQGGIQNRNLCSSNNERMFCMHMVLPVHKNHTPYFKGLRCIHLCCSYHKQPVLTVLLCILAGQNFFPLLFF